ncbi:hypothetical protein Xoosp13_124 [Xanthomonas phage Xoo-sp13]|nr:hypothetical protein Xoosp13_124 [Xanthomonas phage Xoo-sp13]
MMSSDYYDGIRAALAAIAAIPYGATEDQTNGHEEAYRAVQALVPPHLLHVITD